MLFIGNGNGNILLTRLAEFSNWKNKKIEQLKSFFMVRVFHYFIETTKKIRNIISLNLPSLMMKTLNSYKY